MPPWLISLPSCPSTNTWALAHAGALAHGAVVWTTQQTAGRGRQGRSWLAPAGVLTATFVLELPPTIAAGPLSLAAGLAVIHACDDLQPGLALTLKWPNDVLLSGRKLAGILCERAAGPRALVAVGIGLNRAPQWDEAPPEGIASLSEAGEPPDDRALITALRRYLLEATGLVAEGCFPKLQPQWSARDALAGRLLTIADGDRLVVGRGAGITADGALRLETNTGLIAVTSGHIIAQSV